MVKGLKECNNEISAIMTLVFNESLGQAMKTWPQFPLCTYVRNFEISFPLKLAVRIENDLAEMVISLKEVGSVKKHGHQWAWLIVIANTLNIFFCETVDSNSK